MIWPTVPERITLAAGSAALVLTWIDISGLYSGVSSPTPSWEWALWFVSETPPPDDESPDGSLRLKIFADHPLPPGMTAVHTVQWLATDDPARYVRQFLEMTGHERRPEPRDIGWDWTEWHPRIHLDMPYFVSGGFDDDGPYLFMARPDDRPETSCMLRPGAAWPEWEATLRWVASWPAGTRPGELAPAQAPAPS